MSVPQLTQSIYLIADLSLHIANDFQGSVIFMHALGSRYLARRTSAYDAHHIIISSTSMNQLGVLEIAFFLLTGVLGYC